MIIRKLKEENIYFNRIIDYSLYVNKNDLNLIVENTFGIIRILEVFSFVLYNRDNKIDCVYKQKEYNRIHVTY